MFKRNLLAVCSGFMLSTAWGLTDTASHDIIMNVNEVAMLKVNDSSMISLTVVAPNEGGEVPVLVSNTTKMLQYTSVVAVGATRKITAGWASGSSPKGTKLNVTATSPIGGNKRGIGTSYDFINLSAGAGNVVTGIGSCATGFGGGSGASLTYTLSVEDPELLEAGESKTVTVTYTMTDAS